MRVAVSLVGGCGVQGVCVERVVEGDTGEEEEELTA